MASHRIWIVLAFAIALGTWVPGTSGARADAGGDPAKGYRFLVNGDYVGGCGFPYDALRRAGPVLDFVDPLGLSSQIPLMSKNPFGISEVPGRTGLNRTLEYRFNAFNTRGGTPVVNFSCLSCHAGQVGDQVIVGLGNAFSDYTQDVRKLFFAAQHFVRGAAEEMEYDRFMEPIGAVAPYIQPRVAGVNPAVNLTYAVFAHRDPKTLQWSRRPLIAPPSKEFPPVDMPPWWRMKKKNSMFYNGELAGDVHRVMMLASSLCVESTADAETLDAPFKDVEAYIRSIDPPKYPLPIHQETARRGQAVFEANCAKCHGTYGPGGQYPEKFTPISVVKTDPGLLEQETGPEHQRFRDWLKTSFYGQQISLVANPGYLAPPLDGIWATAPFLHNGSVPTLEGVLDSRKRPKYWLRNSSPKSYDIASVAWSHKELSHLKARAIQAAGNGRFVYDTTVPGYLNTGHTFGDKLTDDERTAVIEYLKTL